MSCCPHYLWCLQNSIIVHSALTDLVIWEWWNTHLYSTVWVSTHYNFKSLSFSRYWASRYMATCLHANLYTMIMESSVLQTPWKRSSALSKNNDAQWIFQYCAVLHHSSESWSLSQATALKDIHGLVDVWLMVLYFPILLCIVLYAPIPPFLDSPPSEKSLAQLSLICCMVCSNTTLYSIVLINAGFSLSSTFQDVFGLVGVWITLWYWKILLCIAMYL